MLTLLLIKLVLQMVNVNGNAEFDLRTGAYTRLSTDFLLFKFYALYCHVIQSRIFIQ